MAEPALPGTLSHDDVIVDLEDSAAPVAADPGVVTIREEGEAEAGLPRRAILHADGSVELPLLHPVALKFRTKSSGTVREEVIDRLVLHRLTGADMRAIGAAGADNQVVVALARSARIFEGKFGAIFDRMDGADAGDASQIVGGFLGTGQKTGR